MRRFLAGALSMGILMILVAVPARAEESDSEPWGYDEGLYFHHDTFQMKLGLRPQFLYAYTSPDNAPNVQDFQIRRLKFFASGWAYQPWLEYKVQFNAVGFRSVGSVEGLDTDLMPDGQIDTLVIERSKSFDLEDMYVDLAKNRMAVLRIGQYKTPFGLQFLTSSGRQQFVERSLATIGFVQGRDIGLGLHGKTENRRFGYEVGIFNGNRFNAGRTDDADLLYVARFNFDPNGEYKKAESATGNPDEAKWTIGGAWFQKTDDSTLDLDRTSVEGFLGLHYRRLFLLADYFTSMIDLAGGGETDSEGYTGQFGIFFIPKKFEVALRYSEIDPDTDLDENTLTESRIAFNYFFRAHRLKLQIDFGRLTEETPTGDIDADQVRAQLQFIF
ncbi:MAG: porin [Acidobacteria bacterium]|nr:porin [Acidobacteriota bacterium]